MKKYLIHIYLLLSVCFTYAQSYFRGEVKDDKNTALSKVRIQLYHNNSTYYTNATGHFSILINDNNDSAVFSFEGYEPKIIKLKKNIDNLVILKISGYNSNKNKPKLISVTKDQGFTNQRDKNVSDETYFQLVENEMVDAKRFPNTRISLNINKASYSNIRRFINAKSPVPPDAVRIEELLNYFNLNYIEPEKKEFFKIQSQLTNCPWDEQKDLLYINVNAKKIELKNIPPGNFVFLIDVSGSMDMPNRLPLLQAALQLFVKNLRSIDTISIVTYGGGVGIWLTPTGGNQKEKILQAVEKLSAYGDTPGEAAIITAYKLAQSTFIKNGNNRIILATDGDFNVGQTSEKALEQLITQMRQSNVYLTCLGVGMGNFKDSKLETLAKKGNGNFAYLDDLQEAEKVLVKEITQNFYAVADDVFMNIKFNADIVEEYRLIGFDNRKDAIVEEVNDVEGGEVGSGSSIMAIFEVVVQNHDEENVYFSKGKSIATINLRFTAVNDSLQVINYNCPQNFSEFYAIDKDLQFATALAMFGLKLKFSKFGKNITWNDIQSIAEKSVTPDNFLQNEFLQLVIKAKKIYSGKKERKIKKW